VLLATEVPDGSSSALEREKIAASSVETKSRVSVGGKKSSCRLGATSLFVLLR